MLLLHLFFACISGWLIAAGVRHEVFGSEPLTIKNALLGLGMSLIVITGVFYPY